MSSNRTLWIPLSVGSVLVVSLFLSACGVSTNAVTPTANATAVTASVTAASVPAGLLSEKIIRYILADSQLGNRIDDYRNATDQPNAAEAVCRWDKGVRVQNIGKFERKVVGSQGWNVVYAGTDTVIDGMDVTLTSDVTCATVATPNATQSVTEIPAQPTTQAVTGPLIVADSPQCQNSYWPIVTGGTWNYTVAETSGTTSSEQVMITKVWQDNGKTFFSTNSSLNGNAQYQCIAGAIYDANNDLVLPNESNLLPGYQFTTSHGSSRIQGGSTVRTTSGVFNAIGICSGGYCEYYAQNVGLISATEKGSTKSLNNLSIPQ